MDYHLNNIILILFTHFIGDYVLQTKGMAKNKYKDNEWLTIHILVYGINLFVLLMIFIGFSWVLIFYIILNMGFHLCTDYITSKAANHFYIKSLADEKKDFYTAMYWRTLGFDQFLHGAALVLTYKMMYV